MISVIIVSWNTCDLLRHCLDRLYAGAAGLTLDVIVVDNASTDDTVTMVQSEFPQVRLLAMDNNLGYAAGNNLGMAAAQGEYLFLLNPDTELVSAALPTLVQTLEKQPHAGLVGPQLQYGDGTYQPSCHALPCPWTLFTASTPLHSLFAPLLNRLYYTPAPIKIQPVGWLTGAALLLRRQVYEQVGGFDAQFFMYFEETDWQRRIKAAGWSIVYVPTATIIHYEGAASGQVVAQRQIRFNRSRLRYAAKWHGTTVATLLKGWLRLLYFGEWAQEGAKWLMGHKRPLRRERMEQYRQLLSRL